ncbi:short-chain dehydrogenase [Asticcacaulis sp. AC460]|uniref:SDR family oxidoreductase n=1 Tax=Asticcacaulis sp. AC460 TaxID=1282360 RepID=UPI0003C3FAA9|nr:SDR family oxidoreductase [Asticcacaulis sp. AC460]ESQ87443.1 short-chain dehydrogenase [Asticcacaulis sp. AC460]
MSHISNKTVLVSGANRGIGAATVRELLKTDVKKIYAAARKPDSLPDFGDARVVPLALDITNDASVTAAAATASDVEVLINNAGTAVFAGFLESPTELIEGDMNTNYYGTLRVIRAFTPHLVARGSGVIANVVSVVGLTSAPGLAGYSASKAALQSLTQTLRANLKSSGVKVLGIYPGPIDTDMARDIPMDKASPEHAAAEIVRGVAEGETYIFPDPVAKQIGALWEKDGRTLDTALVGE